MVGNGEVMQERMMMSQPAKPPNKHNTKPLGERMDWTDGTDRTERTDQLTHSSN